MTLFRRAASLLEQRGASGSLPWGNSVPLTNGQLGSGSFSGQAVTENTALQVTAVYGSVSVIADALSTLPIELFSSPEPSKRRKLPPSSLLIQPYAEISRMDWIVQYVMSLALRGNFYGQIVDRDQDLYPTQIMPVHPDAAAVRRLPSGQLEYKFNGQTVPIDNVVHVRNLSVAGNPVGLNPIEFLKNTLGLARATEMYGGAFFSNSALPSGIIEVADDLDEEEAMEMKKAWMQFHQGIGSAHMPAVLTGGATFKPISITPEDAQFLATRSFSQAEISGMIFRVPPHMIGIVDRSTSWGRGIEQQERGFIANTLSGYIVRLKECLTLLHPDGQFVDFDLKQRERGDKLERSQAYSLGMLGGWLCADDIRAEEGMPPVPEGIGGTFLTPINTEPLKAALAAAALASSAEPPDPSGGAVSDI